ncbi:hypothetical protein ACJMK2_004066, partial [Sinanodonta woodiana]
YDAFYPDETGELVPKKGMVWRRFREFINLHLRLEDNPEYKKSLKGAVYTCFVERCSIHVFSGKVQYRCAL